MKREDEITAALEEVKRLDAEATKDWTVRESAWANGEPFMILLRGAFDFIHSRYSNRDFAQDKADATLIARYRTLAPLLASELERVRKENAWQDIASAPRDGTLIEVYRFVDPWHVRGVAYWKDVRGISGWLARPFSDPPGVLGLAHPTHWRALLPLPPQAKGE